MSTTSTIAYAGAPLPNSSVAASMRRISWGAIAAGVVIAVAMQLVLGLLGAGLGLSTIDPLAHSTPDGKSLGIGAVVWVALSSAIALFAAGAIASYLSGSAEKSEASLHGLVTWAVASIFAAYLVTSIAGALTRGAASVVGAAATATATGVAAVAAPASDMVKRELEAQGVSFDSIKAEARKLLAQTGKPELQPGAVTAKASAVAGQAASAAARGLPSDDEFDSILQRVLKAGKDTASQVDRDALVNVVMARSNVSREEAQKRVDGWIASYQQAQAKFAEQKAVAEQKARELADAGARASSQAALGAVVALLIGAAAATLGGLFGRSRRIVAVAALR